MKKNHFIITVIFLNILFNCLPTLAVTISGVVKNDAGEPLPYANVFLKDRFDGAVTDQSGCFSFQAKGQGNAQLLCSFIGYTPFQTTVTLSKSIELLIVLKQTEVEGNAVRVTASAYTASDEEGVTLTSLDVVRTPGAAADLFWAIKTFPGLQQVDAGAGLFVRGGDVSETTMLLDGAVIQHPYKYESPTGGFFGTVNPFLLKGTFFSSGGYSAQYGNALSAALVMDSQDMPEQRALGVGLGLAAESIFLAVPIIDGKFGVSCSGNRSNTKMLFEWNDSRQHFSNYPFSTDLNLGVYYNPTKQTHVKLFMFQQDDNVGVQVVDPDYVSFYNGDSRQRFINLHIRQVLNSTMWINANAAYSTYDRDMTLAVMNLALGDQALQGRMTLESLLPAAMVLRLGMTAMRTETTIDGSVPESDDDVNPDAPRRQVATDYQTTQIATFAEMEWPMVRGIVLTPGVRGEWDRQQQKWFVAPRLNLTCTLSSSHYLTAAWGMFYQTPEPRYFDPYIGNPDLHNMEATHGILGYYFQHDERMFRVEVYRKNYQQLLLNDGVVNYTNYGNGYATGVDIFLKDAIGPLSGRIAYSWLRSRRHWLDAPSSLPPYFDIPHNLTLVATLDLPGALSLGSSLRYATGKPYTSAVNAYHHERVPDYYTLDLSLSKIFSFYKDNRTIFYLALSNVTGRINIFDYRYSTDYQRREPVESSFGRSFYFGVQMNVF
jgi:vitamin B12 transporter